MQKHPLTFTVAVAIIAAFLGEFGSRGLDAMSNFIISKQWCAADNDGCLFLYQLAVLVAIVIIAFWGDSLVIQYTNWSRVNISIWYPLGNEVLGGLVLHNNSWVNLEDCVAELTRYEDSEYRKLGISNFSDFYRERGGLPRKLYWFVNREFETAIKIGRGKEGFLAITFPVEDKDQIVVGKTMTYQVITDGVIFSEPIKEGLFELRISAQVNSAPLPLLKIGVRIEIENGVSVIKEVKNISERKILFWKVNNL